MKKIIILSSIILLVANILFGAILSFYGGFNVVLSSMVIVATGILLYLTDTIHLIGGYKISLMLLFAIAGALELILSLLAPNQVVDNWWFILVIGLLAVEVIILIITNTVSNTNK